MALLPGIPGDLGNQGGALSTLWPEVARAGSHRGQVIVLAMAMVTLPHKKYKYLVNIDN